MTPVAAFAVNTKSMRFFRQRILHKRLIRVFLTKLMAETRCKAGTRELWGLRAGIGNGKAGTVAARRKIYAG